MPLPPQLAAELRRRLDQPENSPELNRAIERVLSSSGSAFENALTLRARGEPLNVSESALVAYFDHNGDESALSEVQRAFVTLALGTATPEQEELAAAAWVEQSTEQRLRADERSTATRLDHIRGAARLASQHNTETRSRLARELLRARWPVEMVRDQDGQLVPNRHDGEPECSEEESLSLCGFSSSAEFLKTWLYFPIPRGEFVDLCSSLAPDWAAHTFWRRLAPTLQNDAAREIDWKHRTNRRLARSSGQISNMPRAIRAIYERPVALRSADIEKLLDSPDLKALLPRSLFAFFGREAPKPNKFEIKGAAKKQIGSTAHAQNQVISRILKDDPEDRDCRPVDLIKRYKVGKSTFYRAQKIVAVIKKIRSDPHPPNRSTVAQLAEHYETTVANYEAAATYLAESSQDSKK
jgi:hypothetical protein